MHPSPSPPARLAGLARYGSSPGSLLASIADSIISSSSSAAAAFTHSPATGVMSRFLSGESSSPSREIPVAAAGDPRPSQLVRHSSSPPGFISHLVVDNGYSVAMGLGNYHEDSVHAMPNRRLQSQLSFSTQDSLSQISEITDDAAHNYISSNFPSSSWEETNSIVFSSPTSKRARESNEDVIAGLNNINSQVSLEMATVEKLLQSQLEYVSFKIRAKRGCATQPRSIAERERRTRISEKLRKLQDLVPNMDKQTNTADMLDLAVQHIKSLQSQVQKLNGERANCKCAS